MTTFAYSPAIEDLPRKLKARKLLTWLLLFTIVMFFAGLTSAYVVSMSGGYWVDIRLPDAFLVSTGCIAVSSLFIQMALTACAAARWPACRCSSPSPWPSASASPSASSRAGASW